MFLTSEEKALGSLDSDLYYTLVQQYIHPLWLVVQLLQGRDCC